MKNEVWKDIPGYERLYLVSNLGRIKSLYNYRKYNILTPKIVRGYYQIGLRKNGVRKWKQVHRLVAQAFIENIDNLPQVNHKDENKLNNNVDNLEWCSVSYNNTYGSRIKKVREKVSIPVIKYDILGNYITEYESISEAGRKNNVSPSNICKCVKGAYKQVKGYVYSYKRGW